MILRDYHVHTNLCDGRDTPEEIVKAAISKGFETLGFSGHAPLESAEWCMSEENIKVYREKIAALKEEYKGQIEILCGIEQDYYSPTQKDFDYIIGSVHLLETPEGLAPLDDTAELLQNAVKRYFGGNPAALAERYFETVADVVNKTGADIVGHLDLILKFNDQTPIFDTEDKRYMNAARYAIEKLSKENVLFEVNTGATVRGYRKNPYPEAKLLKEIHKCGADVIITGDCHDCRYLSYGFKKALELVKACGFKRIAYLSNGEVRYSPI